MGIASKIFEPFNNLLEKKAHCHRKITIQSYRIQTFDVPFFDRNAAICVDDF